MSLLDDIPEGAIVGLDTAPIIYHLEGHPVYGPIVRPFFVVRVQGLLNLVVTSTVSLLEALVAPLRNGRSDLANVYRDFLVTSHDVELVGVSVPVAEKAADLRARYGLRLADACQLAAALQEGASHFLTNDAQLRRVRELTIIVVDDYLPPAPSPTPGPVP